MGLESLRQTAELADLRAPAVSEWTTGMHVHHCCLTMTGVCRLLLESRSPLPSRGISILREAIFLTGRIPRGRAKSPVQVLPEEGLGTAQLLSLLDESERQIELARGALAGAWFRHFALGVMDRDRTLRFLRIHNRHHARIIADILDAAESSSKAKDE
jgi:hypothetical protein